MPPRVFCLKDLEIEDVRGRGAVVLGLALAVVGGKDGVISGGFPPCGVCRQVMREFCADDFMIYMGGKDGYEALSMEQILPHSFKASEHMAD